MPVFTFDSEVRGIEQSVAKQWSNAQRYINSKPLQLKINTAGGNGLAGLNTQAKEFDKTLESVTRRVAGFAAAGAVFVTVERFFKNLVTSTIEVDESLTKINVNLGQTTDELKKFGAQLFDISRLTGTSFKEAAKGAEELARQGLGAEEVAKRLKDALILSRVAGIGVQEAVSGLTSAINSFNREALTSSDVINKLAAVDTRFAVSSKDLTEAISRAGAAAQDAGVGFDQLVAVVTSAQQTTQRGGEVIGNAFKTIFTRVSRPEVLQQIEQLGIAVKDTSGAFLPAIQILQNVANKYDTLSQTQKQFVSEQIGSVFQINVLKATLNDLAKANGTYAQALKTSSGATDEAIRKNDQLNGSLRATIEATKNSLTQFFSSLGNQGVSPILKGLLNNIEDIRKYLSGDTGSNLGKSLGEGILKGLANVLSGPGFVAATLFIGRTLGTVVRDFAKTANSLLGVNNLSQQRVAVLEQINSLLAQATVLEQDQFKAANSVLAQKEAILAISQRIAAADARTAAAGVALADEFITRTPIGARRRAFAGGYVPAMNSEASAIAAGVGGASASARAVPIENFAYGGGKTGPIVANTDEYIVKNYANGGSAIFNPAMIQKYGLPPGSTRVGSAAGGYVPNAAIGGTPTPGFDINLRTLRGSTISSSQTEELTKLFDAVKKAGDGGQARELGRTVIDFSEKLNKVSQSHVLDKLGDIFTRFDKGIPQAVRAGLSRASVTSSGAGLPSESDDFGAIDAYNDYLRRTARRSSAAASAGSSSSFLDRLRGRLNSPTTALGISIAAPFAAGFIGEGVGGSTEGKLRGAASGALNGAGIGAIFGPAGIGIGAAVGALVGAIRKSSKSLEELSGEFDKANAANQSELESAQQLVKAYADLRQSIKDGASPDVIQKREQTIQSLQPRVSNKELIDALVKGDDKLADKIIDGVANKTAKLVTSSALTLAAKRVDTGLSPDSADLKDFIARLSASIPQSVISNTALRGRVTAANNETLAFRNGGAIDPRRNLENEKAVKDVLIQAGVNAEEIDKIFGGINFHLEDFADATLKAIKLAEEASKNLKAVANTVKTARAPLLNSEAFLNNSSQVGEAVSGISARRFGPQNPFDRARTNLAGLNALADADPTLKELFKDENNKSPIAQSFQRNTRIAQQGNLLQIIGAFIQSRNPSFRPNNSIGGFNIEAITSSINQLSRNPNRDIAATAQYYQQRLIEAQNGVNSVGGYGPNGVYRNANGSGLPYENGVPVQTYRGTNTAVNNAFSRNVLQRGGGALPQNTDAELVNGVLKASTQFQKATELLSATKLEAVNTFNVNVTLDPKLALISNQENVDQLRAEFTKTITPLILQLGELKSKTPAPPTLLDQRRLNANLNRQAERS